MLSLEQDSQRKTAEVDAEVRAEAIYLYCVGDSGIEASLGDIGIERNIVYSIPHRDISAVVHKCLPEPYKSDDEEKVKEWVLAHQHVVDIAWERFGTVLPSGFDTIVKGNEAASAVENLERWLEQNYEKLKNSLERLKGKAEAGVQIFIDRETVAHTLIERSQEIRRLNEEMRGKPPGTAYFYRQKMERVLKGEIEGKADDFFKDFYSRIKKYADDIHIEKTKKSEGDRQMIMNLSVLIQKDKIKLLGEELAKINEAEGVEVRFTGPWPPYSFVTSA